ncbi:MAG: hypothetical protein Q8P50_13400 [Bacillota bacterium]|nr:hypothetical protein [Bacillota bacterium]
MTISVIFVDRHFWAASSLLNANAFPGSVRSTVTACADQLAVLFHSVENVLRQPGLNRSNLLAQARSDPAAFAGFKPAPDLVLVLHNLDFLSGLYATLITAKSFLDVYARLVARVLVSTASLSGFGKAIYEGQKMPGGKLLNWVKRSAPRTFDRSDDLCRVLVGHVNEWAGQAVAYRDAVVHDGYLAGLQEAWAPLIKHPDELLETEISLPTMPDGQGVVDYCRNLETFTRRLLAETLVLLPGVNLALLRF